MRVLTELIGAIILLGMVGLGIYTFAKSWEAKQQPAQPKKDEKV